MTVNLTTIAAENLQPSTVVRFFLTDYKVRSVLTYADRVEVTYFDTNDGQPYLYERDHVFQIIA